MNSGFKKIVRNIFASANPEQMAMGMVDAFVQKNPNYSGLWEQAKRMAGSGNAKEKAVNMFNERGVDIEKVVDATIKEINQ